MVRPCKKSLKKIKVQMKKVIIVFALISGFYTVQAQKEEKAGDEKKKWV